MCACPSRLMAGRGHASEDSGGAVLEWPWGRLKSERGDAQGWGISRCDAFDGDNNTPRDARACGSWSKQGCGRRACESPGRRSLAGAAGRRAECLLDRDQQPRHIATRRCAVSMAMQKRQVFTMLRILGWVEGQKDWPSGRPFVHQVFTMSTRMDPSPRGCAGPTLRKRAKSLAVAGLAQGLWQGVAYCRSRCRRGRWSAAGKRGGAGPVQLRLGRFASWNSARHAVRPAPRHP